MPDGLLMRRRTIVAEALIEKLEKLHVVRLTAQRELDQVMQMLNEAQMRVTKVDNEINEVAVTLSDYQVDEERNERARRIEMHAERNRMIHGMPMQVESRGVKEAVIEFVGRIVSVRGSVPTRELHDYLRTEGLEVLSRERLSQILSESGKFEADRTKGWSLKR